jgi:transcriptional regulator GlxA family with amidase domain
MWRCQRWQSRCMTFVLLPNFSLIAFSSAIEPLRIANQLAGQALFEWEVLSETGRRWPVPTG